MTHRVTRRAMLCALAWAPSAASRAHAQASASGRPAGLRLRTVVVDASRVAALGDPSGADRLAHVLARQICAVFGDLMAPGDAGGATLVARMSSLYLTSYAGSRDYGGRHSSGSGNDSLEGVGLVTSGGRRLSETPILAVLDPGYSGPWYLPDIDDRRVDSISHQFAWWLRREMGV